MKPRFSILAMFCGVAFLAVNVAALLNPPSYWHSLYLLAWMLVVAFIALRAFDGQGNPWTYASRAAVICCALYLAMPLITSDELAFMQLPDYWLTEFVLSVQAERLGADEFATRYDPILVAGEGDWNQPTPLHVGWPIATISRLSMALAFGLLGGAIAVWRYRVVERSKPSEVL